MDRRPGRGRKAPRSSACAGGAAPGSSSTTSCARMTLPGRRSTSRASGTTTTACSPTACRPRRPQHLIDAIRQQGYDLVFHNPATDPVAVMHHILWDKWAEDEIGEYQFIGRLFNERGQIYRGCTAFDAANYTLQRLAALDGEMRSHAELRVQLPWWAGNPPEEAGPLLEVIERLRTLAWAQVDSTLRDMAAANDVNSILQSQANAMDAMRASFERPRSAVLLPDFTGEDYSSLETAVLALVPTDPEELAAIEQGVEAASADPENRNCWPRSPSACRAVPELAATDAVGRIRHGVARGAERGAGDKSQRHRHAHDDPDGGAISAAPARGLLRESMLGLGGLR